MNKVCPNPEDAKLSGLLRESRTTPSLPPRFQEAVWRRIETADAGEATSGITWLEALMNRMLRPKFAFATVAALVLMGAFLGVREGTQTARHDAQARYLAAVAQGVLH